MTKLWVSTSNVLVDWTPLSSYFISQICDCLGRLRIYIKIQTVVQRTGQSILVYRLRIYLLTCVLQYKYLSHETCFPGSLYQLDSPCFTFVDYCVNTTPYLIWRFGSLIFSWITLFWPPQLDENLGKSLPLAYSDPHTIN